MPPYKCYIINLDRAPERWKKSSNEFEQLGLEVVRVPAVDGRELTRPYPYLAPWRYFFCYGRPITPQEVACFTSHLKALKTFLETDDEYALICEDDVTPSPQTLKIIDAAFEYADCWDLLRLNAYKPTKGPKFATLFDDYALTCDVKTSSGAGAQLVNRRAAQLILSRITPIRAPYDVALFYNLPLGFREASVSPSPIYFNQLNDNSCIGFRPRARGFGPFLAKVFVTTPYRLTARSIRKISRWRRALACWFRCRNRRFSSHYAAR